MIFLLNENKIKYLNDYEDVSVVTEHMSKINDNSCIELDCDGELSTQLFKDASIMYLNPTEDMVLKNFVKDDDCIATVLSSGDFVLESIFHGAKNILAFDINGLQLYPASLKISALQNLNYNDYFTFLSEPAIIDKFLSSSMYRNLKDLSFLDANVCNFFNYFFLEYDKAYNNIYNLLSNNFLINNILGINPGRYSKNEYMKIMSHKLGPLFGFVSSNKLSLFEICRLVDYSGQIAPIFDMLHGCMGDRNIGTYTENEDSFNKTKEKIAGANIEFIRTDILSLKDSLKTSGYLNSPLFKGFDSIYLSNIPEYIDGEVFADAVSRQLVPLLSDDGCIVYCCQGVSTKSLNSRMSNDDINFFSLINNPISAIQYQNDLVAFSLLKRRYKLDTEETNTHSNLNGLEDKDTFVYLKKR